MKIVKMVFSLRYDMIYMVWFHIIHNFYAPELVLWGQIPGF